MSLIKRISTQNTEKRPTLLLSMVVLKKILIKSVNQEVSGFSNLASAQMVSPFEKFSMCVIERISILCCTHLKREIFPYDTDTHGDQ